MHCHLACCWSGCSNLSSTCLRWWQQLKSSSPGPCVILCFYCGRNQWCPPMTNEPRDVHLWRSPRSEACSFEATAMPCHGGYNMADKPSGWLFQRDIYEQSLYKYHKCIQFIWFEHVQTIIRITHSCHVLQLKQYWQERIPVLCHDDFPSKGFSSPHPDHQHHAASMLDIYLGQRVFPWYGGITCMPLPGPTSLMVPDFIHVHANCGLMLVKWFSVRPAFATTNHFVRLCKGNRPQTSLNHFFNSKRSVFNRNGLAKMFCSKPPCMRIAL